jgi:hypothetical protein
LPVGLRAAPATCPAGKAVRPNSSGSRRGRAHRRMRGHDDRRPQSRRAVDRGRCGCDPGGAGLSGGLRREFLGSGRCQSRELPPIEKQPLHTCEIGHHSIRCGERCSLNHLIASRPCVRRRRACFPRMQSRSVDGDLRRGGSEHGCADPPPPSFRRDAQAILAENRVRSNYLRVPIAAGARCDSALR